MQDGGGGGGSGGGVALIPGHCYEGSRKQHVCQHGGRTILLTDYTGGGIHHLALGQMHTHTHTHIPPRFLSRGRDTPDLAASGIYVLEKQPLNRGSSFVGVIVFSARDQYSDFG